MSYGGGDATGGNASCTYSFTNFNELDVQHYNRTGFIGYGVLKEKTGAAALAAFPTGTFYTD